MAVIGAAHGIKGELRVKTFTGDPLALGRLRSALAEDVARLRDLPPSAGQGGRGRRSLQGRRDRNAAERLPAPSSLSTARRAARRRWTSEFYHADLVGLSVKDEAGETVGQGDGRAEFRRRRHSRGSPAGRKGVADPLHRGRSARGRRSMAGLMRVDPIAAGLVADEDDEAAPSDGVRRRTTPARAGESRR